MAQPHRKPTPRQLARAKQRMTFEEATRRGVLILLSGFPTKPSARK